MATISKEQQAICVAMAKGDVTTVTRLIHETPQALLQFEDEPEEFNTIYQQSLHCKKFSERRFARKDTPSNLAKLEGVKQIIDVLFEATFKYAVQITSGELFSILEEENPNWSKPMSDGMSPYEYAHSEGSVIASIIARTFKTEEAEQKIQSLERITQGMGMFDASLTKSLEEAEFEKNAQIAKIKQGMIEESLVLLSSVDL